jgi:prophage regulatory protein
VSTHTATSCNASPSPLLKKLLTDYGSSAEAPKKKVTQWNFDSMSDAAYIRQAQLIPDVVPFSSATLWRKCKAGQFPAPVKLSQRVTAWNCGAVRLWLEQQAKQVA